MVRLSLSLAIGLICSGCSSLEKVTHYRVRSTETPSSGWWSIEPTSVHDSPASRDGFVPKLIYQKKTRLFQVNQYQHVRLTFGEYGNKVYAMGPALLPIIPVFGLGPEERKINLDTNLSFTISFWSDPVIEKVIARLPNLEIMTSEGKLLKPRVQEDVDGTKHFVYDTKIRATPSFTLRKAEIKLSNGRVLTIPQTKFELRKSIAVNLINPIGP